MHSWETAETVPATAENVAPRATRGPLLDNGVVATNLGKGDWIWQMPTTESHIGVATVQGVIDYEVSLGMKWITVKCGDGGSIWTQFNSDLVTRAHNAGLKIFGWGYAYGNNVAGEINVAVNALNLGADGFIIDAETEYETNTNRFANAITYASAIKTNYPNRFLAHAPFPYLNVHSGFPYVQFGQYCDAVMPQDYWGAIGTTPENVVVQMNSRWRTWQTAVATTNPAAIKPLIPIGQSYAPVTGAEMARFANALLTNTPMATAGGYNGISFWDAQERTTDMDNALRALVIGPNIPPYFLSQPLSRALDTGAGLSLSASAGGPGPISYRWRFNNSFIGGATGTSYSLVNAHPTNTGYYSVVASNANGSVTSRVVSVTVYPPQTVVFSDNFDSNTAANWMTNKSSSDTRVTFNYNYAADGIASAPHSVGGTTRGMKLEANMTAGAIAALSLSPVGQSFAGDHRLHFDMWMNVNGPFPGGGVGSTEYVTAGIGTAGNRVQWTGGGTTADGYWFSVDGEGGVTDTSTTTSDYAAYVGTAVQLTGTGIYAAGTDATARGNLNSYYVAAIPGGLSAPSLQKSTYAQQSGALDAGTVGFAWHDVMISRRGNIVEWSIDGFKLATVSNATFAANNVFIGYWDPFISVSDNAALSFGLVDNVRVEVPSVAPTISGQPQDTMVVQGSNATFTVTASGVPSPTYQWRFNGTNIQNATASSYTRANAQPADAGPYSVLVSNVAGFLLSSNATLTVNVPPTITNEPVDLTVNQGDPATFSVGAFGSPSPAYQWQHEGTNVAGTSSDFVLNNTQPDQAGAYRVILSSTAGSVTSQVAMLTVNIPPSISGQPQDQTAAPGSNATFTVLAGGTAPMSYQWRFEGADIAGATTNSFTRANVQTNDVGQYSVFITNMAGSILSSNAILSILSPEAPHFDLISLLPDQRVQVVISGGTGRTYLLEISSNLLDWTNIATLTNTTGMVEFIDDPATNAQRIYRVKLAP